MDIKYTPKNIKELLGSDDSINDLADWLNDYETNATKNRNDKAKKQKKSKKTITEYTEDTEDSSYLESDRPLKKKSPDKCSCAIITGEHGVGKTTMVNTVLKELKYNIKYVNISKETNGNKNLEHLLDSILNHDTLYNIKTISNSKSKKVIVIDDIQSYGTHIERKFVKDLMKENSIIWYCPIIFIASNKHKKFITDVKKDSYQISMYVPEYDVMSKLLERVCLGENMLFEDERVFNKILDISQNDFNKLLVIMNELHRLFGTDEITNKYIDKYISHTEKKDEELAIYDCARNLFCSYKGINNTLKSIENDKTNMLLMMQQYHISIVNNYSKNKDNILNDIEDISINLSHADVIDNYIFSDQNWKLQDTHGFYSCVYPSYKLSKITHIDKLSHDMFYPSKYSSKFKLTYPKDQNKTSTRCINYKNVKISKELFKDMSVDDYMIVINIISEYINSNNIKEIKKLIEQYNIPYYLISHILKIDKMTGTKKDTFNIMEKKIKIMEKNIINKKNKKNQ